MITSLHYVCSKEGHFKPRGQGQDNKSTPKKQMQYSRTDHNHDLVVSPSKARFLRSHHSITKDQKDIIHMLSEQNISTAQIMSFMATKEEGSQNIHFTRKDLNNEMFMDCHTSIYKFVIQFEKIVSSRYDKEDEEDFRSKDSEPTRDICTRKAFTEFKNQLRASTRYEINELEASSLYNISSIESSTSSSRVNSYTVRVDRLKMHHIPDQYIMKRWTKNAKRGFSSTNLGCMVVGELPHLKDARFNALLLKMQKIPYIASQNFEAFEMACEDIDKLVDKIIAHNEALKEKEGDNIGYRHATIFTQSSEVEPIMKDPSQSQCKGKRKQQKFKPSIERVLKKLENVPIVERKGIMSVLVKSLHRNRRMVLHILQKAKKRQIAQETGIYPICISNTYATA
ncbi:hypothetical protein ACMD2_09069 [Ananas comosus]|uniref:Protein FAR1-RELATED SEQUENCE n=1 Tax=Ananas comosus TaxID=4615 RepID=A0A199VTH7_ANACO|nr:hypothetical protein ACMD2_09069 [Ananas comosus]